MTTWPHFRLQYTTLSPFLHPPGFHRTNNFRPMCPTLSPAVLETSVLPFQQGTWQRLCRALGCRNRAFPSFHERRGTFMQSQQRLGAPVYISIFYSGTAEGLATKAQVCEPSKRIYRCRSSHFTRHCVASESPGFVSPIDTLTLFVYLSQLSHTEVNYVNNATVCV